ncbi:hypothetical protein XAC2852_120065 [Xanthomonas citri pv. citri]|nr:hypothetical protein XAC2852_120065 [Xanthomonas citri pv. citri]
MFGRVPRRKQGFGGSDVRYVEAPNARMANPRGAGASLARFPVEAMRIATCVPKPPKERSPVGGPGFQCNAGERSRCSQTCGLPAEARADRPFLVAVAIHTDVAVDAPVLVQLHLGAKTAVEVVADVDATLLGEVFVASQCIDFEVLAEGVTQTGFNAVAVEVDVRGVQVQLAVGNARNEVGARGDFVVEAHADAPLLEVRVGVLEHVVVVVSVLLAVIAEHMEVRSDGVRGLHAPAVRIATFGRRAHVIAFDEVVGEVFSSRSRKRQSCEKAEGQQRSLHDRGTCTYLIGPALRRMPFAAEM